VNLNGRVEAWIVTGVLLAALGPTAHADIPEATLYYPFNTEVSAGVTPEAMGSGLDLSLTGSGAELSTGADLDGHLGGSFAGSALHLTSGYASHPDNPLFEPSSLTVAAWVYIPSVSACGEAHCSVVAKGNTEESGNGYWLVIREGGQPRVTIANGGDETEVYASAISEGHWHHLAFSFGGERLRIYINGVLDRDQAIGHSIGYGGESFLVGAMGGRSFDYRGDIDELMLYDTVLSGE
jgi:hypothetical protein